MADPVYDEVAAFLGALVAGGMRHIVLSPGSRSTPLTVCAASQPELTHWMQLDERSAAFFALGIAKSTRTPVALVCTSGTAAANYFPAVIEAARTGVPLLVLSADRPPELHAAWGTNQTIDQDDLFGRYPRMFHSMPVGGTSSPETTVQVAEQALVAMGAPSVGPVHLNWPFRKPLEPVGSVPVAQTATGSWSSGSVIGSNPGEAVSRLGELAAQRGVIVAGPLDDPEWTAALAQFAEAAGWPILAESTSQLRLLSPSPNSIATSERFLLVEAHAASLVPEVMLFVGATPTGTSALQWADQHQASKILLIDPAWPWSDAGAVDADVLDLTPDDVSAAAAVVSRAATTTAAWIEQWRLIDTQAGRIIGEVTAPRVSGPSAIRAVAAALENGSHLLIANSMSVRDLDRYTPCRSGVRVHVSRGASGIDGQVATALGIAAATAEPVTLVIGDIAFLHDIGSLFAATRLAATGSVDLTIVVLNDNGGGIFSMLPIAQHESIGFTELFHTPHDTDFAALAALENLEFHRVPSDADPQRVQELVAATGSTGDVRVIEVVVDHSYNLAVRSDIQNRLGQINR